MAQDRKKSVVVVVNVVRLVFFFSYNRDEVAYCLVLRCLPGLGLSFRFLCVVY